MEAADWLYGVSIKADNGVLEGALHDGCPRNTQPRRPVAASRSRVEARRQVAGSRTHSKSRPSGRGSRVARSGRSCSSRRATDKSSTRPKVTAKGASAVAGCSGACRENLSKDTAALGSETPGDPVHGARRAHVGTSGGGSIMADVGASRPPRSWSTLEAEAGDGTLATATGFPSD